MERAPNREQSRFGPAESRAQIFSTFTPGRLDREAGKGMDLLANSLGQLEQYESEKQQRDAREERDAGLRDYVSGLVQDGQRIQDGELTPIESRYYMAGVEMGRGRRRGREVWRAFAEWQAENPRPGLNSEQGYEAWLEEGLATAQEQSGVDPDNMSEIEMGEYAGIVNQVRQRDNEQLISQVNREAAQEQLESITSDISAMGLEFDPENLDATYETSSNLLSRARANGLDLNSVRRELLTQFSNIARETGDVSILENMPPLLKSAEIDAARMRQIDIVEASIESDQYENETGVLQTVQDAMQAGDFHSARVLLDASRDNDTVRDQTYLNWDARVDNETRSAQAAEMTQVNDRLDLSRRNAAIQDAHANGTLSAGVTYTDHAGEAQTLSMDDVAQMMDANVFNEMGRTPEALGALTTISEQTGVISPAVASMYQNIMDIPVAALSSDDPAALTDAQKARIETLFQTNDNVLSMYMEDADLAEVRTARFMYSTGEYTPGQALAVSRQIGGETPTNGRLRNWRGRAGDRLDDETGTPMWDIGRFFARTQVGEEFANVGGQAFALHTADRYDNFDRDTPAGRRWESEVGLRAAQIESVLGKEAANDYIQSASENTMIVNRQPVNGIGELRGPEGSAFMHGAAESAGLMLAAQFDFSYGDSWFNDLFGRSEAWDPSNPAMRELLAGEIEVQNVQGGYMFSYENERVYLRDQSVLSLHRDWRAQQGAMNSDAADQQALDNTRDENNDPRDLEARQEWLRGVLRDHFETDAFGQ